MSAPDLAYPRSHRYQHGYGVRVRSNWGMGDELSEYAEGDLVFIPEDAPAFVDGRVPHGWSRRPEVWHRPGRYRVVQCLSIGEDAAYYYRVSPIHEGRTMWDQSSDRIHVVPGHCDLTEGWELVRSAERRDQRPIARGPAISEERCDR